MTPMSDAAYIYELVDNSHGEEVFYTHGVFLSLQDAIVAVDTLGNDPTRLGGSLDAVEGSAVLEIRWRVIGLQPNETGTVIWKRIYVEEWQDDPTAERWSIKHAWARP